MRTHGDARPETLQDLFDLHSIQLHGVIPPANRNYGGHRTKLYCPQCHGGRQKEKNFFIKVDADGKGATWQCFRQNNCGYSDGGRLAGADDRPRSPPKVYRRPAPPEAAERPDRFVAYFTKRGISAETLQHFGLYRTERRMPVLDADGRQTDRWRFMPVIAYPYRDTGSLTNIKYKAVYPTGHKRFVQEADCEPTLYNIDSFTDPSAGFFVEGENDCLALFECGFHQVTTLPNGSPPKIAESYDPTTDDDDRYLPIRPGDERIDRLERCYLAGDMDEAGARHHEEMARRLGKHRCWLVRWPEGCKDADETLRKRGADAVRFAIEVAEPYPLPGVVFVSDAAIADHYAMTRRWRYVTGFNSLDERLRLSDDGLFLVTTGVPGHGKTEFWNAYSVLLAERQDEEMALNSALRPFHTVLLSSEMDNDKIAINLLSSHVSKPFYPSKGGAPRLTMAEVNEHFPWVRKHFTFLKWEDTREPPTISWALNTVEAVVRQTGAKLAVIDPWQEFDDEMPPDWRNTTSRWITRVLWKFRGLAMDLRINLVLIAHPKKLTRNKNGKFSVPGGYDIAESQAFSSVPHVGLTINRPNFGASHDDDDDMDLHCWKMRELTYGRVGNTSMRFDRHTHRLWPRPTVAEAVNA